MRQINVKDIVLLDDKSFKNYGKVITDINCNNFMEKFTDINIPHEGNIYEASVSQLEHVAESSMISEKIFGNIDIEIGFCNGRRNSLNALEYHKSSEVILAVSDLVLILGEYSKIETDGYFNTAHTQCVIVQAGTLLELYPMTLHFAPCSITNEGFKSMIVLPKSTNEPLSIKLDENNFLFRKNKWLLAHKDADWLTAQGAMIGLKGENIEIVK